MTFHFFTKEHEPEEVKEILFKNGFRTNITQDTMFTDGVFGITQNYRGNRFQIVGEGARDIFEKGKQSEYFTRFKEIAKILGANEVQTFYREKYSLE